MERDNIHVPDKQRALILQGGGALGAYEAGAFKRICDKLRQKDQRRNGEIGGLLFDIVAGTSIGAINASIIVSHFGKNNNNDQNNSSNDDVWNEAANDLLEFWNSLSSSTTVKLDATPWEKKKKSTGQNNAAASPEAARRYYSVKKFLIKGVHGVFDAPNAIGDNKFFDDEQSASAWLPDPSPVLNAVKNVWMRYDSSPLEKNIKTNRKFPIRTSYEDGQPRLLAITVDVAKGTTVIFDSYDKPIDIPQVMASGTVPLFYDYREILGHKYWDGGIISNTPVREVIEAHRNYWEKKIGSEKLDAFILSGGKDGYKIPDLELFIINVIPSKVETVPTDYDGVKDRLNDIHLLDKSDYDIRMANTLSQYFDFVQKLISFNKRADDDIGDLKRIIANVLNMPVTASNDDDNNTTTYQNSSSQPQKYIDTLKTAFKISNVIRIERRADPDSVSGKFSDFTEETIKKLINDGIHDAEQAIS